MSLRSLLSKLPPRPRLYVATAIYGVAGGGSRWPSMSASNVLYGRTFEAWAEHSPDTFMRRTLGLMLAASLLSGVLLHVCGPAAAFRS